MFPLLVLMAMGIMVALNLNGSSIGLVSTERPVSGLEAGTPRPVRSDEWVLQTPIAVSSVRQGYPRAPWIGLNRIDQAATSHGGPTHDWSTLFKPQDWGYLLGAARGLSVSWWWSFAVGLLGCYALLTLLTRRALVSAGLACAAVFTPYAGWWTSPSPALFIGYATLTAALVIAGWTVSSKRSAALLAVAAAAPATAFALALYPPWQISIGYVIAAVLIGYAVDRRIGWRRFLWPVAITGAISGTLLGLWYASHRAAISSQVATIYPGQRISTSGGGALSTLQDGPLNFWMVGDAGRGIAGMVGEPPGNLSEAASSWLPLPVVALVVLGVIELWVRRLRRGSAEPDRADVDAGSAAVVADDGTRCVTPLWTLGLTSAVLALLLAWALLDLPRLVGSITLLDRVEGVRTPAALGLAAIVLVAAAAMIPPGRRPVVWSWPVMVGGAALTAVAAVWTDRRLPWDDAATPTALVLASGLVLGLVFGGLLIRRVRVAAAVTLAVYAVISWGLINPLQHGIDPLVSDPLAKRLATVTRGTHNPRVTVFARQSLSLTLVARIRGAGLQSLTGTTPYPDRPLMRRLAPGREDLWNNYAQYAWTAGRACSAPVIKRIHGSFMSLTVAPCDPLLLTGTHPGWTVSDQPLQDSCLRPAARVARAGYPRLWIYRVTG